MKKTSLFQTWAVIGAGVFIFGILPYCWLTGSSGGMLPCYVIAAMVFLCTLPEGGVRLAAVLSLFCVAGLLIAWDSRKAGFSAFVERPDMSLAALSAQLFVILAALAALLILRSRIDEKQKEYADARLRMTEKQYLRLLSEMENLYVSGSGPDADAPETEVPDLPYPLLRSMLACRLTDAGENGIALRLESALPGGLELSESELSLFLGTILDHASHACAALKKESPVISLRLSYKPDYLIAQIAYPAAGSVQRPDGGKVKNQAVFLGLADVDAVVERQNGLMRIEFEGGMASIHLALFIPSRA